MPIGLTRRAVLLDLRRYLVMGFTTITARF
jgi:hypothetical protein